MSFGWSLAPSGAVLAPAAPGAAAPDVLFSFRYTSVGEIDEITSEAIPPGDLAIVDGELSFCEGAEASLQELDCRLQFFLGECFLDTRQGFPYHRDVFVKSPNPDTVRSLYRRTVLSVPGIVETPTPGYSLDPKTRFLSIDLGDILHADGTITPAQTKEFVL